MKGTQYVLDIWTGAFDLTLRHKTLRVCTLINSIPSISTSVLLLVVLTALVFFYIPCSK